MLGQLPEGVQKYFWGDDLGELSWEKHKDYIVQNLLNKGDEKAVAWLLGLMSRDELRGLLPSLKLEPKSANFWKVYLS